MLTEIEYLGSNIKTLNDIGSFQLNTQNKILKDDLIFKITGGMDSMTEMFMTRNFPSSLSLSDVTCIGAFAFYNCSTLTSISFPQCSYIGSNAFYNCKSLTNVNLPQCNYIGQSAFEFCSGALDYISLPQCSYIGSYAFYGCSRLRTIVLMSNQVVSLGSSNAFAKTGITSTTGFIDVPYSLMSAYRYAYGWSYFSNLFQ